MIDARSLLSTVPPPVATAGVLIVAAVVTLLCGLLRSRRAFLRYVPAVVLVVAGAATFLPPSLWRFQVLDRFTFMIVAACGLLLDAILQYRARAEPRRVEFGSLRTARIYVLVALAATAGLLFYRLGDLMPSLETWEAPVVGGFPEVGGFAHAFQTGQGVLTYTARRLLWDDGVLSGGHTSLFYGAPTYALFHVLGFSPWTLRFFAALATLLSVMVIYALGRRFFGPVAGGAAAVLLGLNHCVLYYGRYGSSPAGTLLAVLLALLCTWLYLDEDRSAWWMGGVCAVALFLATLQYSTARIVVLILLGFIPLVLVCQWRRLWWQRSVGFLVIVAAAIAVWHVESSFRATHAFLFARGEQFLYFVAHPQYVDELFGRNLLGRPLTGQLTLAAKIELLYRVLETTVPQFGALIAPRAHLTPIGDTPPGELPNLYYAPLVVFLVWGIAHSLRRWRSWPHACLLLWAIVGTVPILLTNRVDSHRTMLFVVPIAIWLALGVWEAAHVMWRAKVPRSVQHLFAGALALTVVYNDAARLYGRPTSTPIGQLIANEVATISGPVAVGALYDHRDVAWMQLALLERERRDPGRSGTLITDNVLGAVEGSNPSPVYVRQLRGVLEKATLLLAPADRFRGVAAALQNEGIRVAEPSSTGVRMLRFDVGAAGMGVADKAAAALPTIVIRPTPTPLALAEGPQISLTQLTPTQVTFGFVPPKIDRTWADTAIVMGGVRYEHGIGTHAWCRMTYAVPPGSTAFQAIIGLSDEIRSCAKAAVTFEVRDDKDRLLFDSGLVDASTPPMPIHVDLQGAAAITLVVTEGGNGRDCDHANWALPAFLRQ